MKITDYGPTDGWTDGPTDGQTVLMYVAAFISRFKRVCPSVRPLVGPFVCHAFVKKTHGIENIMCRNDPEGLQSQEYHQNSSLAYLPPKVAIAVLR